VTVTVAVEEGVAAALSQQQPGAAIYTPK